ncbi:hypothetical protein GOP47_0013970 [Adiantum capillus-veneris]|uniref:Uncharacterized protein n=1 Tax=Adiantum capillus-veneris TaxID=13818 RepID=A0A9D4UPI8_ADICA|nr:hypothetical protein GOP47_0013970 [Adiantum capillus-veneris]
MVVTRADNKTNKEKVPKSGVVTPIDWEIHNQTRRGVVKEINKVQKKQGVLITNLMMVAQYVPGVSKGGQQEVSCKALMNAPTQIILKQILELVLSFADKFSSKVCSAICRGSSEGPKARRSHRLGISCCKIGTY